MCALTESNFFLIQYEIKWTFQNKNCKLGFYAIRRLTQIIPSFPIIILSRCFAWCHSHPIHKQHTVCVVQLRSVLLYAERSTYTVSEVSQPITYCRWYSSEARWLPWHRANSTYCTCLCPLAKHLSSWAGAGTTWTHCFGLLRVTSLWSSLCVMCVLEVTVLSAACAGCNLV